jgi:lactoylglutathione lyase
MRMPIRDEAINVFMGLPGDGARLELTHNFGVESYDLGTATTTSRSPSRTSTRSSRARRPRHRAREAAVPVSEGGSRICFVRDPDGYRIELIERSAG